MNKLDKIEQICSTCIGGFMNPMSAISAIDEILKYKTIKATNVTILDAKTKEVLCVCDSMEADIRVLR